MGRSHSKIQNEDLFNQFKKLQWTRIKDQGHYELWQNTLTSQICQAYQLDRIPNEEDLETYRFRHYNQKADNFVEVRYIDIEKNPSLCNHGESFVLTEFIPVKLGEMHNLSLNQGYSILRASFRAFHTMGAFHELFTPNEDLIGINLNGKPKIWLNVDHSKNQANQVTQTQNSSVDLEQISYNVKITLEMVQGKIRDKHFPTDFRNYFYNNVINFSQASQFVEDYCDKHQIHIPNTIQYIRFVKDEALVKIIQDYKAKQNSGSLSEKNNTMESTLDRERIAKQQQNKVIQKIESYQIIDHHDNSLLSKSQSFVNAIPTQQTIVQKKIISPIVQRISQVPTAIPSTVQLTHSLHRESRILSPPVMIPSQNNLRSRISVVQAQPPKLNPEPAKNPQYKTQQTPAHIIGNFNIIPPNKIVEFEIPVRNQTEILKSEKSGNVQKSESKHSESIHQKMRDFSNEDLAYLNESVPIYSDAIQIQKPQPQHEDFQNYINDNSQINPDRSERSDNEQNVTSEPDWEQIQNQNQQNQQNLENNQYHEYHEKHEYHENCQNEESLRQNHYEQQAYEHQQYEAVEEEQKALSPTDHQCHEQSLESKNYDISPIKENPVKNIEEFQNHYAMFAKYAHLNQNGQLNLEVPQNNIEQQDHVANSSSFQPRNLDLNQSVAMSDQDQNNATANQEEQNEIVAYQHQMIQAVESSQNIHRNSSKNTSINRNGESSGTLVVHDSQQNIYQGVNNEERNYQIKQESIQQNSQESQNQEQIQQNQVRKELINQLLTQQNHEQEQIDPQWKTQQQHFDEVKQSNDSQNQQEPDSQLIDSPKELTQTNQYNNLHFRNQSDELYQYTPVESVYRTESGKHWAPSLAKPSGVEELTQLEKHQDIEEYIRKKYSGIIGGQPLPVNKQQINSKFRTAKDYSQRAMTFAKPYEPTSSPEQVEINTREQSHIDKNRYDVRKVDSHYEKIDHFDSHVIHVQKHSVQTNQQNNDFLDVGNLEKSLDQKYNKNVVENNQVRVTSPKNGYNIKGSQTMSEEDGMNVAALEQRLLKFEERQSIEREKSQRKIETQVEQPVISSNNELNFNELDNIVELMDKKIQESQKKQQNKSSQEIRQNQKVSEFAQRDSSKNHLENIELQTSLHNIHNKQISLKDIPVLGRDGASNTSNSITASKRDYNSKYEIASEELAAAKGSSSNDYGIGKERYPTKRPSKTYESKKYDTLTPVVEMDRKYENYSSKNKSSYDYSLPQLNAGSTSTNNIYRNSSRRSSKNIEEAKRLAEQISNKYDKYMSSESSSNYEIQKPFAKKSYTNIVDTSSYENESSRNVNSSKYINEEMKQVSGSSRVSARDIQRKRSSYLNPIEELNCQNWASPLKESTPNQNPQNYLKLSNQNSRAPSARNIEGDKSRRNSKVSYDELRDLLWK